jgi:hypothetical protein
MKIEILDPVTTFSTLISFERKKTVSHGNETTHEFYRDTIRTVNTFSKPEINFIVGAHFFDRMKFCSITVPE